MTVPSVSGKLRNVKNRSSTAPISAAECSGTSFIVFLRNLIGLDEHGHNAMSLARFPAGLQPTDLIRGESRDPWLRKRLSLNVFCDRAPLENATPAAIWVPAFAGKARYAAKGRWLCWHAHALS